MVITLGIATSGGVLLPAAFAIGPVIPLLIMTILLVYGVGKAPKYLRDLRKINTIMQKDSDIILILAGLNDIIAYWFI